MLYALRANEMREAEFRAVSGGVTSLRELMRRAGEALADEVRSRRPDGPIVVACGPGSNGGDGWVAARSLHEGGREVLVVAARGVEDLPAEAAEAARRALTAGVVAVGPEDEGVQSALARAEVVIDALFGFGFHGPAREPYGSLVAMIASSRAFVVSADVPSGVDSDTGVVNGPAVQADVTVTFSAPKPGLYMYPGAALAGEVIVADIGIPASELTIGGIELPEAADLRPFLPVSAPNDHKGSRGRVAIVGGSHRYPGAAVLAVEGALRMGAGYVVAIVPEALADIIHVSWPSALVRAVPAAPDGSIASAEDVLAALSGADAIVAGPGLSSGAGIAGIVKALAQQTTVPLVLDADAVDALGADRGVSVGREAPLLVTPHPGEAARMLHTSTEQVQADRIAAATSLAGKSAVCLLKGARTVVAGGGRVALVRAGNAGLARAGSGDVLAGMLGTLLAQRVPPYEAALLGAFLHGRAAEYGTRHLTETCFTSGDITAYLPDAVRDLLGG